MPDQPAQPPSRGEIKRVEGRRTAAGKKSGLPKIHEIEIEHADGRRLVAQHHGLRREGQLRTATGLCAIERGRFPFCPICLREEIAADTAEHVPPVALGGAPMANTCADCNNRLGSRTESALQDWYDGAARIRFTSDVSQEPFGRDRILVLEADSGESVMLMERSPSEEVAHLDRLNDPNVEAHFVFPRQAEYKTALLKSAYLATCLHFGGVPHTPTVVAAREEILLARDAKTRREVQLGPVADGLRMHRTGLAAAGPPLALMRCDEEIGTFLISLAGTVLVEWPFPDLDPMSSPRARSRMAQEQ